MSATIVPPPTRHDEQLSGDPAQAPSLFGTDLDVAPLPIRGLVWSVLVHVLFAVAVLAVPWSYWMPAEPHLETLQTQVRQQEALLLPDLQPMGGGSPAAPSPGAAHAAPEPEAPAASGGPPAVQGVVYPGPQIIVSNPPHPDNSVQTILQPDLRVSPKLPIPLPIPPMVNIAPVKPVLVAPAPEPAPPHPAPPVQAVITPPLSLPQQLPKVEAPKLPLPSAENSSLSAVANASAPTAKPKLAPAPAPPPLPAQSAVESNALHNILVVDALPVLAPKPAEIPPGESHGAFTVSPTGTTSAPAASASTAGAGGGTAAKGQPGTASAAGTGSVSGTGTGAGTHAGGGNASAGSGGEAKSGPAGSGAGTAAGTGLGNGTGTGSGAGKLAANGSGTGTGHGSGSGSASGSGTGTGRSPFPDIMIQGGSSGSGRGGSTRGPATAKPQTSYGMIISASGASGGAFRDYGIFEHGVSYTVYLDMEDAGLYGSNWPLQYGLDLRSQPNSSDPPPPQYGVLEPPYAQTKTLPHLSVEEANRTRGGTVVVFGVIDPKGQWQGLRIMQSPDPGLNQLVLDAMAKWTFKPAELGGAPVSVKCLLGVLVNALPID